MAHYKIHTTFPNAGGNLAVFGAAYTAVPGGNNAVGVPWTQAIVGYATLKNRRGTGTQAVVPVDATTQAALDAGTLFEWRWQFDIPSGLTGPQARAALEVQINAQEAAMVDDLASTLRYWGFEGNS